MQLPSGMNVRITPTMKKEIDTYAKHIYIVDYMDRLSENEHINSDIVEKYMKMFETINPERGARLGEKLGIL